MNMIKFEVTKHWKVSGISTVEALGKEYTLLFGFRSSKVPFSTVAYYYARKAPECGNWLFTKDSFVACHEQPTWYR